jgi:DnaK suppressor protein
VTEELTDAELKALEAKLRVLLAELDTTIESALESVQPVELDQAAIGRVSRIDAIQQQSLAKASREALKIRRSQATRALTAIADGDYGFCRRCEEPIGYRRLAANPETPFCLGCAR